MPDYARSKIYKIINSENDAIYIGSTTQQLSSRMNGHRGDARQKSRSSIFHKAINKIGIEKFRIIFIENYPCENRDELESREFKIMSKYIKDGIEVYNTMTEKGKHKESSKEKVRISKIGQKRSEETKQKISETKTKRGCINFDKKKRAWIFFWYENYKQKGKTFSENKYGEKEAKQMAIDWQDKIYPK